LFWVNRRQSTNSIFQFLGNIHVIHKKPFQGHNANALSKLFSVHFSHIAVIFSWASGNLFHIAWQGNYSLWLSNPSRITPVAHSSLDPNYSLYTYDVYSTGATDSVSIPTYTGLYNWAYTIGCSDNSDLYVISLTLELLALGILSLGILKIRINEATSQNKFGSGIKEVLLASTGYRINYHLGSLIGLSSIMWSLHLLTVALPNSRGSSSETYININTLLSGDWVQFSLNPDSGSHIYGSSAYSGSSVLTFSGGLEKTTSSLLLTDMIHHHLALGVLVLWSSHMYSSLYKSLGHSLREIGFTYGSSYYPVARSFLTRSVELELAISLAGLGQLSSYASQHIYSLNPYVFLASDYVTTVALYAHHMWISAFFMLGSFVHGTLFVLKDYSLGTNENTHKMKTNTSPYKTTSTGNWDIFGRILAHKASLISHLSWVSLWLGFHTLLVYVHNDTVVAFGDPEKQLSITPIYAQIIQTASGKSIYGITSFTFASSLTGIESSLLPIFPTDLMAHHAIALGLHVTVLILLKGALDSRGSRLLPDKSSLGYSFPCDGPGRGGTCDVTAWDAFYLATFWMLNTISWTLFYFHWKHITLWQNNSSSFNESGSYLMAWFRDYLWFNSSPLIRGYSSYGSNDLGVWAWLFLAAHLCWATGFMFLISWRGYWQELIESIVWAHSYTPIVNDLWNASYYSPVALSIVQARFIGLVHFSAGLILTYSSFVIASTS
jgi:photosystem I P700 chlorophyll a apoprotein A2